jgi:hypothetical protein
VRPAGGPGFPFFKAKTSAAASLRRTRFQSPDPSQARPGTDPDELCAPEPTLAESSDQAGSLAAPSSAPGSSNPGENQFSSFPCVAFRLRLSLANDSEGRLLGLVWATYQERNKILLIPADEVLIFVHEAAGI